ncbi:hypothetical protein [Sphingobacterium sp. R2]|uniref:hypothetical protein n=1 Tax=Sphingobacterium sp. R2 TaxID=3112958 RepID=UPI00345CAC78
MKKNSKIKLLALLPFILLSVVLMYFANLKDLATYNIAFVSTGIGIATFSISFSFLQYQFSPYKALLRSISNRHLIYCYAVVFIAVIPLVNLIINKTYVPTAGIVCIPLLIYGAILLPIISIEECNPLLYMEKSLKDNNIQQYLELYKAEEAKSKEKREKLELSLPGESPMHSFSTKYNTSVIPNDPFALLCNVIELGLKNGDRVIFEEAINNFFILTDLSVNNKNADYSSGFRFSVNKQVTDTFEIILGQVVGTKNVPMISGLVYKTGDFLKEKAINKLQTTSPYNEFVGILVRYAKTAMSTNRDCVLYIGSLCRELAQKGVYEPETGERESFFRIHLTHFAHYLTKIGQEAILLKDSDILYRCIEDLGFLGCTAVKNNHYHLTIECLQGLVQLGREARAAEVKCFWRHCALDMTDHVDERVQWMVTWLPKVPENDAKSLCETFSTAYSRLYGKKLTVELEDINGVKGVVFKKSEEKHVESFSKDKYYQTVDYSDYKEIKEFKLY